MSKVFPQITPNEDGWSDWQHPHPERYRLACCDCGLVHHMQFRISEGEAGFRVALARRATAQLRRHCKADRQGKGFLQYAEKAIVEIYAEHPHLVAKFIKRFEADVRRRVREKNRLAKQTKGA